jgi:hypothetical protein
LLAEEFTLRENRRVKTALVMARARPISPSAKSVEHLGLDTSPIALDC